jgi:hypothetical protein
LCAASLGLAACALAEVVPSWQVPWWLYLVLGLALAAAVLRRVPWREQLGGICLLASAVAIMATLYFVPWSTRKPFVRRLDTVRVGASENDVRRIMKGYRVVTTVPGRRMANGGEPTCDVTHVDGGVVSSDTLEPGHARLLFRHSCDGAFDADFGVVELSAGKVVDVRFEPD